MTCNKAAFLTVAYPPQPRTPAALAVPTGRQNASWPRSHFSQWLKVSGRDARNAAAPPPRLTRQVVLHNNRKEMQRPRTHVRNATALHTRLTRQVVLHNNHKLVGRQQAADHLRSGGRAPGRSFPTSKSDQTVASSAVPPGGFWVMNSSASAAALSRSPPGSSGGRRADAA